MPLADAVREAVTLLAFASRSGKTIDPRYIKPILEMNRLIDGSNGTLDVDEDKEQAFWLAYSAVVTEIQPVTSDSINATLQYQAKQPILQWLKRSAAQKTVFRYGVFSLFVLLSIIYFQTYMQMGMCIRDHLQSSFRSQRQSVDDYFTLKIKDEDSRLKAIGMEGQENHIRRLYEKYKVELQLAKLRASQDELYSWGKEGDTVLQRIGMSAGVKHSVMPAEMLSLFSALNDQNPPEMPKPETMGPKQPEQASPQLDANSKFNIELKKANKLILLELESLVIPTYIASNESEQVIRVISEFILPLLYGLLGACAYILRDLTNAIGSVTFSKSSMINYSLRLIMGPLVGIAVGLFLGAPNPNLTADINAIDNPLAAVAPPTVPSLGTMALAFLAGYSVEVLFSALDSLVGAFASKHLPKEKPSNKAVNP